MQTVVVYEKGTREIIACVPMDGSEGIVRKDVQFRVYNGTEPIFTEIDGKVLLNENAFIIKNGV